MSWNELSLLFLDPLLNQCELEVQRIVHLQNIVNQLSDAFTDPKRVTKSHVVVVNAPIKIYVPKGKNTTENESKTSFKCRRLAGFNDKNP